MKKNLLYLFSAILILLNSCKKDDSNVFEKSPDERLNEALSGYQKQLSGTQYGWKAYLQPGGGGEYFFFMKFNDSNRVKMLSDFDSTAAVTLKESSFRLKALLQPSLLFDTYSYLHTLADPNPSVNGGPAGSGLVSDFEFYFDKTSGDTIKLIGRFNKSKLTLIKATQQEYTALVDNKQLGGVERFKNIKNSIHNYWKQFTVGATKYEMDIYAIKVINDSLNITLSYLDGSSVLKTFTTPITFNFSGGVNIIFKYPLVNGATTISGFSGLTFDNATQVFSAKVGTTPISIAGGIKGINIDLAAPKRWWDYAVNNGNDYWICYDAVHKDGIDDYLQFKVSVPTLYYMHMWPKYNSSGSTYYDVFGIIYVNAAGTGLVQYGTAPVPTFTSDGRVTYTYLGALGTTPNAATTPKVTSTTGVSLRTIITQTNGFYLVQIGPLAYDMVSANDAKTWMKWVF